MGRALGTPRRAQRAVTFVEMLVAMLILSFIIAAAATFYNTAYEQQRQARGFSRALTDLRSSLRVATRAIRHGFTVVGTTTNFGNASSSATQLIVTVPEPTGTTPSTVQLRYYLSGGVLYKQRSDQAAPGTALADGITTLTFTYYQTVVTTRNTLPYTVGSTTFGRDNATEVLMTVTATREKVLVRDSALILLRNKALGF